MKKLVIYLFAVMAIMACEPIVDDVSIGGVIPESELNLTVKSVVEGGNELVLENNTPGVGSLWDFMIAKSSLAKNVIVLPFMGEITITFTGICDGGTVTTTRTVNVTKITTPVAEEWNMFAGSSVTGKSWVWDETAESGAYGYGGYGYSYVPDWGSNMPGETSDGGLFVNPDDEMVFDLDGGANFTRRLADGKELGKGSFVFDMSKKKIGSDGKVWSIGTLEFKGVTIPCPGDYYSPGTDLFEFDIISLSEDKMVLAWAAPDAIFQDPDWGTLATYWCFRKK